MLCGRRVLWCAMAGAPCVLCACGPTVRPSFDSPEPAARNAAIVNAAGTGDRSATPGLIRMLRSDDPCTRLLAIETLEQLHGTTMGYDCGAEDWRRAVAIRRWEAARHSGELEADRKSVQSSGILPKEGAGVSEEVSRIR